MFEHNFRRRQVPEFVVEKDFESFQRLLSSAYKGKNPSPKSYPTIESGV